MDNSTQTLYTYTGPLMSTASGNTNRSIAAAIVDRASAKTLQSFKTLGLDDDSLGPFIGTLRTELVKHISLMLQDRGDGLRASDVKARIEVVEASLSPYGGPPRVGILSTVWVDPFPKPSLITTPDQRETRRIYLHALDNVSGTSKIAAQTQNIGTSTLGWRLTGLISSQLEWTDSVNEPLPDVLAWLSNTTAN